MTPFSSPTPVATDTNPSIRCSVPAKKVRSWITSLKDGLLSLRQATEGPTHTAGKSTSGPNVSLSRASSRYYGSNEPMCNAGRRRNSHRSACASDRTSKRHVPLPGRGMALHFALSENLVHSAVSSICRVFTSLPLLPSHNTNFVSEL
jgi:hypothetical protein